MKLYELRELINDIPEEYDDLTLTKGNSNLGEPEVDVSIKVLDYLEHPYIEVDVDLPKSHSWDGTFTDIYAIADEIKRGRKIGAIKEVRNQTLPMLRLKEAKFYMSIITNLDGDIKMCEMYANYWMNMALTGVGKKRELFHGTEGPEFTDDEKIQDCMDAAYRHIKRMGELIELQKVKRNRNRD